MKTLHAFIAALLLLCLHVNLHAQDPSAILDLESTTDGVLIPRMTTSERIAISSPVMGLLVFDTDSGSFWYYEDGMWTEIMKSSDNHWLLSSGSLYSALDSTVTIKNKKVGIGMVNPMNTLDIMRETRYGIHPMNLPLYVTGEIGSNFNGMEIRHTNGTQGVGFGYNSIYATGSNTDQNISLFSRGLGHILFNPGGNGNVGIGTATPSEDLDVEGQVRISSLSGQAGALVQSSDDGVLEAFSVPTATEVNVYPVFEGECRDSLDLPTDVFVLGSYAYVTSRDNNKLVVFDVTDPANPVFTGEVSTGLHQPHRVHVSGNYAFVICFGNDKLVIFDISNPESPSWVGESSNNLDNPWSLSVSGNYVYVANLGTYGGFVVFDVSTPSNPVDISNNIPDSLREIRDFVVSNSYAYGLEWWLNTSPVSVGAAFHVYDVSDPNNPLSIKELTLNDYFPIRLSVVDDVAYIIWYNASNEMELTILDVSNPALPIQLSSTVLNIDAVNIFVEGDYCYLIHNNGLAVYNVSDPVNVVKSGLSTIGGRSVFIQDDYGYVAGGVDKLVVFDAFAASLIPAYHRGSFSLEDNPWKPLGTGAYTTGQVGIGTTDVDESLVVDGVVKMTALKIESDAVAGKVLTSDADGYGAWQDPGSFPGLVPIGAIISWVPNLGGVPSLPDAFVLCNGQVINDAESPMNGTQVPDLMGSGNEHFLRGGSSSGSTGGSDTHTHTVTVSQNIPAIPAGSAGQLVAPYNHTHTASATSNSNVPKYYTVNWIIRIK